MSNALPKNLIELLHFVPPCKEVRRDENGHWICYLAQPIDEVEIKILKLRFGCTPGIVTAKTVTIHRSYLSK